jgi:hypothetical protein
MKYALALILAALAAPCFAQDFRNADASVLYFVNVPLGAQSRAERDPSLGFALQGRRSEHAFRMQLPLMKFIGGGVIEAKYLILGAAAAGIAAVAGGSDKSSETQKQQQAEAATEIATNGPAPCPDQPGQCFAFGSRRYHFIRF